VNTAAQQESPAAYEPHETDTSTKAIARRLRVVAGQRAEEFLAEVPATLRRVRTLLLMLSIAIPAFLLGLIVVLWHLAS
jgi:hypothetical protein